MTIHPLSPFTKPSSQSPTDAPEVPAVIGGEVKGSRNENGVANAESWHRQTPATAVIHPHPFRVTLNPPQLKENRTEAVRAAGDENARFDAIHIAAAGQDDDVFPGIGPGPVAESLGMWPSVVHSCPTSNE
jgi:hypothetical protein